ncbi:MAG: ATP phosphoribosyltransferase regulatory subunit [Anaerolineae bacterium]|nr:ATP phosphoribosyltransferase regulatory subunit [Anaerolineae bacterium]
MPVLSHAYRLRHLETLLIEQIAGHHYDLIEIPIIENADIFLTRAGDKIIDSLLTFEHRGQQMALRPEFTAAAARHYLQTAGGQVVRWLFSGATFTGDPEARGYQQHSTGAELIGLAGPAAEAEVMHIAARAAAAAGLTGWHLVSGHVGLQSHLMQRFGLDSRTVRLLLAQRETLKDPARGIPAALEQVNQVLSFISGTVDVTADSSAGDYGTQHMLDVLLDSTQYGTTMGGRTREEIAARVLQKYRRSLERSQITAGLEFLAQWVSLSAPPAEAFPRLQQWLDPQDTAGQRLLLDWMQTIERVLAAGVAPEHLLIQPDLARNWEYYTGVVFGIRDRRREYVAGGGRYDELVGLLGGQPTPAAGFTFYVDRLLAALAAE